MRYLTFLAAFAVAMLSGVGPVGADDEPVLKSVTVTFHTRGWELSGDSKRADTHVRLSLYTVDEHGGHAFAQQPDVDPNTAFEDPSDKGPYDVPVSKAVSKSVFLASKTGLQIVPTGQEKWDVKVEIVTTLDDGSTVTVNSNVLEMTSAASFQSFDNQQSAQAGN
jgi:uncharacterized membrane protein